MKKEKCKKRNSNWKRNSFRIKLRTWRKLLTLRPKRSSNLTLVSLILKMILLMRRRLLIRPRFKAILRNLLPISLRAPIRMMLRWNSTCRKPWKKLRILKGKIEILRTNSAGPNSQWVKLPQKALKDEIYSWSINSLFYLWLE